MRGLLPFFMNCSKVVDRTTDRGEPEWTRRKGGLPRRPCSACSSAPSWGGVRFGLSPATTMLHFAHDDRNSGEDDVYSHIESKWCVYSGPPAGLPETADDMPDMTEGRRTCFKMTRGWSWRVRETASPSGHP